MVRSLTTCASCLGLARQGSSSEATCASKDMQTVEEHWLDPRREELLPMPGTLATELPYLEPTCGLGVRMFTRPPGEVPLFKLDRSHAHQLVEEQKHGISLHRVAELNELMLAP